MTYLMYFDRTTMSDWWHILIVMICTAHFLTFLHMLLLIDADSFYVSNCKLVWKSRGILFSLKRGNSALTKIMDITCQQHNSGRQCSMGDGRFQ
jgi:hypothetical protein